MQAVSHHPGMQTAMSDPPSIHCCFLKGAVADGVVIDVVVPGESHGSLSPMTASYSRSRGSSLRDRSRLGLLRLGLPPYTDISRYLGIWSRLLKRYCLTMWLLWRSVISGAYCLDTSR